MGRGHCIVVLALVGCDQLAGIGDPMPAHDCMIGGLDLCLSAEPRSPLVFDADSKLDTSKDCSVVVYTPPGPSMCVLYGTDVTITATANLFATGSRPFVIAATNTIMIDGVVDVSSRRGQPLGAAANDRDCLLNTNQNTYAGLAGGSFGGKGGNGGNGGNNTTTELGMVAGDPMPSPTYPRGGCPGGANIINGGASGAGGGGAVWLAAGTAIIVNGRVLAHGGGGISEGSDAGQLGRGVATGGGSGGFIRVAAPTVRIAGIVAANGGGGAEGGEQNSTMTGGAPGSDGGDSVQPALGGSGASAVGGDGGSGGAGQLPNGTNGMAGVPFGTTNVGGGGGGGGVGVIQIQGDAVDTNGATISPTP